MRSNGTDAGMVRAWLEDAWRNGEVVIDHDGHLQRARPRRPRLLARLPGYLRQLMRAAQQPRRALL